MTHYRCLRDSTPSSDFTFYESRPVLLSMHVLLHLGPGVKFLTRTLSPLQIVALSLCCHATPAAVTIVGFPRAL